MSIDEYPHSTRGVIESANIPVVAFARVPWARLTSKLVRHLLPSPAHELVEIGGMYYPIRPDRRRS